MSEFTNLNRIKKQAEFTETLANRVIGDIGKHCEARKMGVCPERQKSGAEDTRHRRADVHTDNKYHI